MTSPLSGGTATVGTGRAGVTSLFPPLGNED